MRGWEFYGGSPKEDIEDNINVLRQRSRDAYMGIPTAAAALKTMRTNVIAGGLMPAPQIDGEYLGLTEGRNGTTASADRAGIFAVGGYSGVRRREDR
ncbi:MAG: phage portal protein [Oscillospiraceae bacterium]